METRVEQATQRLREATKADFVWLYRLQTGERIRIDSSHCVGAPKYLSLLRKSDDVAGHFVRTAKFPHVVDEPEDDIFVDSDAAMANGLEEALICRKAFGDETLIAVLGYKSKRGLDAQKARLDEEVHRCALEIWFSESELAFSPLAWRVVSEITEGLADAQSSEEQILHIFGQLHQQLLRFHDDACCTVWVANYYDGELTCAYGFGGNGRKKVGRTFPFKTGLTGWIANNYKEWPQPRCLLVKDPEEELPDGTLVCDQFEPGLEPGDPSTTEAELVVPIVCRGHHLVGVLSVESPIKERFSEEFQDFVRKIAVFGARAIRQRQRNAIFRKLVGGADSDELAATVAKESANFVEAPNSAVFLWDEHRRCLRLVATPCAIYATETGRQIEPKTDELYRERGVGLTRWACEHNLLLNVADVNKLDADLDRIRDDLRRQLATRWGIRDDQIGVSTVADTAANDEREWWHFASNDGSGRELKLPQPVWSNTQYEREDRPQACAVIPIAETTTQTPALGVMRFSRQKGDPEFTKRDLEFLQRTARQFAIVIAREQNEQARSREHGLLLDVLQVEPQEWQQELQRCLASPLKGIQEATKADLVLLRVRVRDELRFVACYPTEKELSRQLGVKIFIPRVMFVGRGGSGKACEQERTYYAAAPSDPVLTSIRHEFGPDQPAHERAFVHRGASELAVPFLEEGEVVGTLSAISFSASSHRVYREGTRWKSEESGIHPDVSDVLTHHASWLGPALRMVQEAVERQRQISGHARAVSELTKLLRRPEGAEKEEFFRFSETIGQIASSREYLAIPQVMLGECAPNGEGGCVLKGRAHGAWGSGNWNEQQGEDVSDDSDGTFRELWSAFQHPIRELPDEPVVIEHSNTAAAGTRQNHRTIRGPEWDGLLDEFRELFSGSISRTFDSDLSVGVVPVCNTSDADGARQVFFVTNLRFVRNEDGTHDIHSKELSRDSLRALNDLVSIADVSRRVGRQVEIMAMNEDLKGRADMATHELTRPLVLLAGRLATCRLGEVRTVVQAVLRRLQTIIATIEYSVKANPFSGKNEGKLASVQSVLDLVEHEVQHFRVYVGDNDIKMKIDKEGQIERRKVWGDPALIRLVISNLLYNAIRAIERSRVTTVDGPNATTFGESIDDRADGSKTRESGLIRINVGICSVDGKEILRIAVRDNGIEVGNPKELWIRYKSGWNGFGLGLHLSRRIAQHWNGDLEYSESPKEFSLLLQVA